MADIKRGSFGSRMGVILATAGSAVGLGNIWRFPYMTGENGGAAFILLYLGCVLVLGIPGMVAEFVVGRSSESNAARAYNKLAGRTPWRVIGYLGVLTSMIILGFYAVVAGWCLQYLFASIAGQINGGAEEVKDYFVNFSSNPWKPVIWAVCFVGLTHLVVARGVRDGIEKASKLLMPLLLVLLVALIVASCLLPGASRGITFLFMPDFSKLTHVVLLEALGQAFFSLSLGTACLCTYASYFTRQTRLVRSAVQIAFLDSFIAILAGLMIFPAAFSVGVNPDSGPSLIFITLPNVFHQAFASIPAVGYVISILFYVLLALAALIVTVSTSIIGAFCSLSLGATDKLIILGRSLFDWFDFITGQIFLPVVGFLTCIFIGWYVPHKIVRDEFTNWGTLRGRHFHLFIFLVKYVCPICIVFIFLHQFGLI